MIQRLFLLLVLVPTSSFFSSKADEIKVVVTSNHSLDEDQREVSLLQDPLRGFDKRKLGNDICVSSRRYEKYSQRAALMDIYYQGGIDDYFVDGDINDECTWLGVHCENGLVRRLDLKATDLDGTISTMVGLLVNLEWLDLSVNVDLVDKVPDLSDLTKLVFLDVADTLVTGDVSEACDDGQARIISYSEIASNGVTCKCSPSSICQPKRYDIIDNDYVFNP
eukprot:CAMPEP_0172483636 /NCGR_PEP_ID=MMETSP1066-20121228/10688_1 /TAXON_ID=671091 /ORGANISM="Coscinodiscus wailesii, Strain CCMP2513" /LENGTH=221 /DNA_ID=CAMNT_0013247609 /DNA_START=82 /DNA_END=747 /DNA_ORIENTATION=-